MKPGSKDILVFIAFDKAELQMLKDNTWLMAESNGLDQRIVALTENTMGFYSRDLEKLEDVIGDLKTEPFSKDRETATNLYEKIIGSIACIDKQRHQ